MEEGGGLDLPAVNKRLTAWHAGGCKRTTGVADFHRALGEGSEYFETLRPRVQATWNKLIAAILASDGCSDATPEMRREFQARQLGRPRGRHALLELMPLPSRSSGAWIFRNEAAAIPWMESRRTYRQRWQHERECMLMQLIVKYQPIAVVMYGATYQASWNRIARGCLRKAGRDSPALHVGTYAGTSYFSLPHPRFTALAAWECVGERVRRARR
jgi:hypothetical protein